MHLKNNPAQNNFDIFLPLLILLHLQSVIAMLIGFIWINDFLATPSTSIDCH